jgi:hypothetical protein
MLRFFRKIQQKLLTEGRRRNYFYYAIGEILLLVIGSLLPFTAAEIVNIY